MNFRAQLSKQLAYIHTSCKEYDSGSLDEAFRIATALRVIFHHTGMSTSLLHHLNANSIKIASTWESISPTNQPIPGLTNMILSLRPASLKCVPKLKATGTYVDKDFWWQGEAIFARGSDSFTRKDFVLWGANKDGGAHVDPNIPAAYQNILDGMDWWMGDDSPGSFMPRVIMEDGCVATLRQIAFEVFHSPELFTLAGLAIASP